MEEILGWYAEFSYALYGTERPAKPDADDLALAKAEEKETKRRLYEEWLAKEGERMLENQNLMLLEDKASRIFREYLKIGNTWAIFEQYTI